MIPWSTLPGLESADGERTVIVRRYGCGSIVSLRKPVRSWLTTIRDCRSGGELAYWTWEYKPWIKCLRVPTASWHL